MRCPFRIQRAAAARQGSSSGGRTFSRRQALDPKVVNVGRFLGAMDDMLHQAIGIVFASGDHATGRACPGVAAVLLRKPYDSADIAAALQAARA